MNYIGIDFHKQLSYVTRMDEQGKIVESFEFRNSRENLESLARSLSREDWVAMEAVGHWMYGYEAIEDSGARFVLSHPQATKAIASARLKNDKVDSAMLAHLLRTGLLPAAYIPPRAVRDLREVLRLRTALAQMRSVVKIRLRSLLLKTGNDCPYTDVLGKSGIDYCRRLGVRPCYRLSLDHWLELGLALTAQLSAVEVVLAKEAKSNPEAELLMTIPGVGLYSALLIMAEIGEISRFQRADKLVSWAGLAPDNRASAHHIHRGPITKRGSKYLRWILTEVSHHAVAGTRRFADKYEKVAAHRGKNKARIAVAAAILRSIHWMLTHKQGFRDI